MNGNKFHVRDAAMIVIAVFVALAFFFGWGQ